MEVVTDAQVVFMYKFISLQLILPSTYAVLIVNSLFFAIFLLFSVKVLGQTVENGGKLLVKCSHQGEKG